MGKLRDLDRQFFTPPEGEQARRLKTIGLLGALAILIVGSVTVYAMKPTAGQLAMAVPLGILVGGTVALFARAISR